MWLIFGTPNITRTTSCKGRIPQHPFKILPNLKKNVLTLLLHSNLSHGSVSKQETSKLGLVGLHRPASIDEIYIIWLIICLLLPSTQFFILLAQSPMFIGMFVMQISWCWLLSVRQTPFVLSKIDKQRVLMHRHQGWNVRHGLCHIYMRYLYIYELFIAFVCFVVCSLL